MTTNFKTTTDTLAVFDFDNTLYYTPENTPENVKLAKEKYESEFIGWWGRKESLDVELFDIQYIEYTKDKYIEHKDNGDGLILLTGRPKKLESEVTKIIDKDGFSFDDMFLCNGMSTDIFKVKVIKSIVRDNPKLKTIYFYDDRDKHVNVFRELRKLLKDEYNVDFIFIRVKGGTGFIDEK